MVLPRMKYEESKQGEDKDREDKRKLLGIDLGIPKEQTKIIPRLTCKYMALCILNENVTNIEKAKNSCLVNDNTKSENTSKLTTESKKATANDPPLQHSKEVLTLKGSKPTEKSNHSVCARNIQRLICKKNTQKGEHLSICKKEVSDKLKKYKSLDQVEKVEGKNSSRLSLVERISDVIQKERSKKSASEINQVKEKSKIRSGNQNLLTVVLDNYSRRLNCNSPFGGSNSEKKTTAKSLSSDSLKFTLAAKKLPKTFSLESSKSITPEQPIGVFNVHKGSYTQTPVIKKRNLTESLRSNCPSLERRIILPQKTYTDKSNSYSRNSSNNSLLEYPSYRVTLNEDKNTKDSSFESLLRTKSSAPFPDSSKKHHESSWKEHLQEKKTVEICQCLHFHTEDGIKKICIQNSPKTKELGQKFFRVNYFSKGHDEDEGEMESKVELVDAGTGTENEPEPVIDEKPKQNASPQKLNKKSPEGAPRVKVPTRINANSKKLNKLKRKGRAEMRLISRGSGNKMEISGEVTPIPKQEKTSQKAHTETRTKKVEESTEKKKPGKLVKKSKENTKDKADKEDTLEELELIRNVEKLFLKLNSSENSKIRRKKLKPDKDQQKIVKKESATSIGSTELLLDIEEEEQFLRRRKKLRNAIIRQLKNWVDVGVRE